MEENNKTEKREYKGKKNSEFVNFPVDLRRSLLSPAKDPSIIKAPVTSYRIINKILNDVSNDQFRESNKKQIQQYNLFEDDFKTENNTFARFTFRVSDITDNNDYTNVKRGLEFLENYQKGWYKAVNSKGKTIRSYGGLITQSNISDGDITFLISAYWLEKVLKLPMYNSADFRIPWILPKGRQILFYFWLLEVPDNGTKINFHKYQETYGYNYKDPNTFAKNVLKDIKKRLDKDSSLSFNYSVRKDLIHIKPYLTKDVDLKLEKGKFSKREITQKLHYWKVRHGLMKNDVDVLKSIINIDNGTFKLFCDSYSSLIKNFRGKQKITDYQGKEFIKLFQKEIETTYNATVWKDISPNGFPKIL